MNIFLAGIHGVGKTYFATRLPAELGLKHASASQLIREERASVTWGKDKRVAQVDENQAALGQAVRRHNDAGIRLLLDGHFVLLDTQGAYLPIGAEVFRSLDLDGVVLLEADPSVIICRTYERDQIQREKGDVETFMAEERRQAQAVCGELDIPLTILISPDSSMFVDAMRSLMNAGT